MLESLRLLLLAFSRLLSAEKIIQLLVDLLTLSLQSIDHVELGLELDSYLGKLGLPHVFVLVLGLESAATSVLCRSLTWARHVRGPQRSLPSLVSCASKAAACWTEDTNHVLR